MAHLPETQQAIGRSSERGPVLFLDSFLGLIVCALCVGFVYQRLGARRDRARHAGDGHWVEIGDGCSLFVRRRGESGPPVIFESGIAASHLNWRHIQDEVAQFAVAVTYDRAGLGWSSPCCTARTPKNVAAEMHAMLERAAIRPPYILVGHSFGGQAMRQFALAYPDEVAALILVDPMRCEEWPPLAPARQATLDRGSRMTRYAAGAARIGLARLVVTSALCRESALSRRIAAASGNGGRYLLSRVTGELGKMPREVRPIVAAHWSRPDFYVGMRRHIEGVHATVREMCNAAPIAGISVLVLTPDTSTPLSDIDLSRIGSNVQQVVVPGSAHWIHLDQPRVVVDAIRDAALQHAAATV